MAKRVTRKQTNPTPETEAPLSPEADKLLGAAVKEFERKQKKLDADWGFDSYQQWGFDQFSGTFRLEFEDGDQIHADGQILGSYASNNRSWEWAWNNPFVDASMARESQLVKEEGERLGISFLQTGPIAVPNEEFVSYLCAIGVKITGSIGAFRGTAGPVDVAILLKNPRRVKKATKAPKALKKAA
jgi:uncharacterized protein DUF6882